MQPPPPTDYFTTAVGIAAIIAGIGAVAKAIHYVIQFSKKIDLIWNTSSEIAKQFQKNSGTSLKDVIDRIDMKSDLALKAAETAANTAKDAVDIAKESLAQGKDNGSQIKDTKDDIKLLNNALISRSSN